MTLSLILPCYNEAGTIAEVLRRVLEAPLPEGWGKEIILVDDGSRDETAKAITEAAEAARSAASAGTSCSIRTHFREENGGKGAAVKDGLRLATGEYCLIQDADLEYDPDDYSRLLVPVIEGEATVVFGSRTKGKNNVPFSNFYFYGGLLVARVFNFAFRTRFSDITTCYKLFPRTYVPELLLQQSDDFVFDAVELTRVISRRTRVVEVPIHYRARSRGEGKKLNWRHGLRSVIAILALRIGMTLPTALRIIRFLVSGVAAAIVNVAVLYALVEYAHIWYLHAAVVSFIVAFVASFVFNKFWTFGNRSREHAPRQFGLHLVVAVVNLGINTALVYLFVDIFGVWYILAQILATAIIATESYFAFKAIYHRNEVMVSN